MSDERDYSQSGEQAHILALAAELPVGRFLDIGAADGRTFSNTVALAAAGWGGIVVEPAAWAFDQLVALYADRADITCVQALVTPLPESGLRSFYYAKDDLLSTTDPSEAAKWPTVSFAPVFVPSVSLEELLDATSARSYPSIVSIDAEGMTNQLVREYTRLPAWEEVEVIVYEREDFASRGSLTLTGDFELVATTPNNLIYRRRSR